MTEQRTTVVNLRLGEPYDVYVGRAMPRRQLVAHQFANPYKLDIDGTLEQCLAKYRTWLCGRLLDKFCRADLESLRGKRLGCWCRPREGFQGRLLCHAQILAGLADGRLPKDVE